MGIVDEDIVKVREATDIVKVITEQVVLKRVGRRWVGLCPFHQEKTPSFSVNQELGFFHCFGCQRSGDAITFVREVDGLDFVGAVERLAGKAGVTLHYTDRTEGEGRRKRAKLIEVVGRAVDFYHQRLLEAADAGVARGYLRERGITGEEVRSYQIGWAPDDWDALAKHLDVSAKLLTDAGLAFTNRRNRVQDQFRARILFPIFDVQGDPVGFGGRKLPGTEGPKYKNSPDSVVYAKSRLLYGLHRAKDDIVHADEAIICEGYTDVIGFDRVGMPRAVATCGTALTEDHVKLLKRFAKRMVLAFDADSAGQAAAERFYEWERTYEVDVRVAALPPGVDPAELSRTDPAALEAAVRQARPFLDFRVDRLLGAADLDTAEGRARAAEQAVRLVGEHPNPLVRDQYMMNIADRCRVDAGTLRAVAAGGPVAPSPEPAAEAAPELSPDGPEFLMLRLAVHRPDLVPELVDERLFIDPTARESFAALLSNSELHEAVAVAPPAVAAVLQRVAVQDTDIVDQRRAERLAGELVDRWATLEQRRLQVEAHRTGNLQMGRDLAELQNAIAHLRDGGWELGDAERLVRWLDTRAEERP